MEKSFFHEKMQCNIKQDTYTMDPGNNCIINTLFFNQSPN